MLYIMVDTEADGPCPGLYSMLSLGAIAITPGLEHTFYSEFKPISELYQPGALKVNKMSREQTLTFPDASIGMTDFRNWLNKIAGTEKLMFISDNNGFDWQFVNYYFWKFLGDNPFGHSSTNLGSLYKGMMKSTFENFKHLRRTKHTHNPLDDARGNAETILAMVDMGLKMGLK